MTIDAYEIERSCSVLSTNIQRKALQSPPIQCSNKIGYFHYTIHFNRFRHNLNILKVNHIFAIYVAFVGNLSNFAYFRAAK